MCGIAGIITKTPRAFDYAAFCTLGIANDVRGGDSCGVFIDGKYDYGVKDDKYFQDYFLNSGLINETTKSSIALVHCRKASIGNISKETAQPVVITDNNDKVRFVLIHNGTIYNYRELAEKYIPKIDITGMTDSQVMARIFYHAGYQALDEYNGGAVFAIVDYRGVSPKVMLYKGASRKYKYATNIFEERPLYYCIDKAKRELVFSSIAVNLVALRRHCNVYRMRPNELLEFNGKSLSLVETYKREDCIQTKETHTAYVSKSKSLPLRESDFMDDYYGGFVDYISVDLLNYTYSSAGKKAHGKLYLNRYGKVYSSSKYQGIKEVYFFNGIALKNVYCYRFLSALCKETKLTIPEFTRKFQNVIRFLSIDNIYCNDNLWYQAISPTESILFSGEHCPITSSSKSQFEFGVKKLTAYGGMISPIPDQAKNDFNFKTIREQCKSLMK